MLCKRSLCVISGVALKKATLENLQASTRQKECLMKSAEEYLYVILIYSLYSPYISSCAPTKRSEPLSSLLLQ